MRKEKNENNILDFKSTMEALIEEEKPEVTQEEAIRSYKGEDVFLKKKNKKSSDDETDIEEEEHLKRVKKELLESLDRVNILAKKIFDEKGEKDSLKNIKVRKGAAGGKGTKTQDIEKNKEEIISQMREKVHDSKLQESQMQDEQERSREE